RIHAVVLDLQPLPRPDGAWARGELVARQVIGVEDREIGLRVRRSHIGEHQPVVLVHRIGAVKQPVLKGAVGRLTRGLEDRSVDVEEPAVIAAADPFLANQAEFERGAAMRAMQFEEASGIAFVAERDQILSQNPQARGSSRSSSERATGCQKRLKYSPHGVPGPTRLSSSSSAGRSRWW